jgi:hypothetical protein
MKAATIVAGRDSISDKIPFSKRSEMTRLSLMSDKLSVAVRSPYILNVGGNLTPKRN